jgi:hypothetical protein
MAAPTAPTDARVALLERVIDHAPTFPPASLSPAEALAEDRRAQASPHAFMLGRLVWPASRLDELKGSLRVLSVVADGRFPLDARIEAVEVPPGRVLDPLTTTKVYVERDPAEPVRIPTRACWGAKVRCGGAATPSTEELAGFVRACRAHGIPFKATAGLHHAVRRGAEHGFLNLLAAVVFGDEEAALAEEDASAFSLDADGFRWRDREAGPDALVAARRERLHAIGSCSFFEPVEELQALGLLP